MIRRVGIGDGTRQPLLAEAVSPKLPPSFRRWMIRLQFR